jgi:uncharacterized membrane protein (UPF0127 family)
MIPTVRRDQARMEMRAVVAAILVGSLAISCGSAGSSRDDARGDLTIVTDGGPVHVRVEVADEDDERAEGLMGRTSLGEDAGMAFLWDEPVETSFWMKDTLIPLSIAFWDRRRRIVAIRDMEPCRNDPCPRYAPHEAFVGALEVNQGFFDEHGVEIGDRIEIPGIH